MRFSFAGLGGYHRREDVARLQALIEAELFERRV
jgi:hypothetical protein